MVDPESNVGVNGGGKEPSAGQTGVVPAFRPRQFWPLDVVRQLQ